MKNMENKIRRLPEYKLRFNAAFEAKRRNNAKKPFKKPTDALLEKRRETMQKPKYEELTDDEKKELYKSMVELLNEFDKEDKNRLQNQDEKFLSNIFEWKSFNT